jgi:hypothetical protein
MLDNPRIQIPFRLSTFLRGVHTTAPNPNPPGSPPIRIMCKSHFVFEPFVLAGMKRSLRSFPGFLLWYGSEAREALTVNFNHCRNTNLLPVWGSVFPI